MGFLVITIQPLSGPRHVTYLQERDSGLPGCNDPTTLWPPSCHLPVVAFEITTLWTPFSSSVCRNRTDPPSCSVRNYHALAPASSLICKNSLTMSFLVGAFQPLSGPRHVTYMQEHISEPPGCSVPTTLAFFASPIYKNTAELPGCSALYYHSLVPCLVTYLQTLD